MWVGEKQPDRANINNFDPSARQERLIAIAEGISVIATGNVYMFEPPGYAADGVIITKAVFRCTSFTVGSKTTDASISFGDNASSYDDIIPNSAVDIDATGGVVVVPATKTQKVNLGNMIRYNIQTASDATAEVLDLELWGYLV